MINAEAALPNAVTKFQTLEDIEAFEHQPLASRSLPSNTYDMLVAGARIQPNAPALSYFENVSWFRKPFVWTHRQLISAITKTANAFRRLGIGRNDVIAYLLPNVPETHFVIWGGEAAGIVFAINPLLDASAIRDLLRAGKAKWLVTLAPSAGFDTWTKAIDAMRGVETLKGVLTVDLKVYGRGLAGLTARTLGASAPPKLASLPVSVLSLRKEIKHERGDRLNFEPPKGSDNSSYFCTGGTTGLPKIAMRTHFSEVFDAWAVQVVLGGAFAPGKAIFCGLPLFHVNGQLVTGLCPWAVGGHVVLGTPQGYRADGLIKSFWDIAEHYKIAAFSGVPTIYAALLAVPSKGMNLSSIEYGFCGAAPMPTELFRRFEEAIGIKILEAYGLTESACVASSNPPAGERKIGSIGLRLPYQQMATIILDAAGAFERHAVRDEIGVVAINGPNVFAGYVSAEHNKDVWIEINDQRWLNTGDLARQDRDGYFWLTGRRKELIIRGGHNIDPKLIEDIICQHPAVAMAAAVGRPDTHAGEVPVVYVQLKAGVMATEAELLIFAEARVPERPAVPKGVRILSQLPLTAVGKLFKPELQQREVEAVIRAEASKAGVEILTVRFDRDPQLGQVVRIVADTSGGPILRRALAGYAFKFEVSS